MAIRYQLQWVELGRRKEFHNWLARSSRDILCKMTPGMSGLCRSSLRVSLCPRLLYFQLNGFTYSHIIVQLQVFRLILEIEIIFNHQIKFYAVVCRNYKNGKRTIAIAFKSILLESNFEREWVFCFSLLNLIYRIICSLFILIEIVIFVQLVLIGTYLMLAI